MQLQPQSRSPDAGEPDASVEVDAGFDAGIDVPDAGEEDAGPPPELRVTRLLPPRGASAGGTSVLLEGSAFLRDFAATGSQAKGVTTIRIGGNQVQDFQIIDDGTIELRTPPGVSGPASVSMRNPNGNFVCNNCFTYFDELVVTSFTPRQGPLAGGNEVTITGQGFTTDTQVLFGSFSSPRITFVSSTQLKAIAPRGLARRRGRPGRLQQERRVDAAAQLHVPARRSHHLAQPRHRAARGRHHRHAHRHGLHRRHRGALRRDRRRQRHRRLRDRGHRRDARGAPPERSTSPSPRPRAPGPRSRAFTYFDPAGPSRCWASRRG